MKKFIVNVITHKMNTYTFNSDQLLCQFINGLDIPDSYKTQLVNNKTVSVPSKTRSNSLDVYVINDYEDYFDEMYETKEKLKVHLDDQSKNYDSHIKSLEKIKEGFDNKDIISNQRVETVLYAVYISMLKTMYDMAGADKFEKDFLSHLVAIIGKDEMEIIKKVFGDKDYV